jgi:hypothetical protein
MGGSVISAGTIHDLRWVKVPAHFETPAIYSNIYQCLAGIFFLPETSVCDINKAKYFI